MYTKLRMFRINYKFIIRKQSSEGLKLSIPVGGGLWFSVFIVSLYSTVNTSMFEGVFSLI